MSSLNIKHTHTWPGNIIAIATRATTSGVQKTVMSSPLLTAVHAAAVQHSSSAAESLQAVVYLSAGEMIVRIIMTNVDTLDYNHRVNVTVALADQTAPACIDARLLSVWIPSLSRQIPIYSSFVCFVFVCVLQSFIEHSVALRHQALLE